jgi:hypothetical protein
MALETVTDIDDLVVTNPTASDPKSQGDDHIRNIKTALKNAFPGFTGTVVVGGTTGGSVNAYTLTPSNAMPAWVEGTIIVCEFHLANTSTTPTLNISSLGTKTIVSCAGAALAAGDLLTSRYTALLYDGTNLQLLAVTKNYVDQLAFSSALPAQAGNADKLLTTDGISASFSELLKAGTIRFADSTDTTKRLAYDCSGITAGQTRTATVPDRSGTLALRGKGADIASAGTVNLDTATGDFVHITGTTTITAITLASGDERTVVFDGALTLTHNATTLILPGGANITTAAGDRAIFRGDGSGNVRCIAYTKADGSSVVDTVGNHEVAVHTGNGHGSTNTRIRRFTTAMTNVGTAITYADSATNGASFTINETGIYAIYYADNYGAGASRYGISVDSAQLTTTIDNISIANRVAWTYNPTTGESEPVSRTIRIAAGSVIRPHTDGNVNNASDKAFFSIRKVGT